MDNNQKKDNLSLWLGFLKFVLGTVALGIITAVLNHQIQNRQLAAAEKIQEQAYVEKFVVQALDENLEKRLRFAHYFSSLLKENWSNYYADIKNEYNQAASDLENKKAELSVAEKEKNEDLVDKLQEEIGRLQSEVERKNDVQVVRGSRDIDLLHPEMARRAKEFIRQANEQGINILVYDTYRSIDYQNKLYDEGKTRVKGGRSPHNFGLSFEAVPLIAGKPTWSYSENKDQWDRLGKIAKEVGLVWGGDNTRFKEYPNFEFPNWRTLDEVTKEE